MIFDSLKHIDNYKGLGNVYEALKFIAETDFSATELDKYELNENIYYMVKGYDTKPKSVAEAHEKYIDIQLLVSGEPVACRKVVVKVKA